MLVAFGTYAASGRCFRVNDREIRLMSFIDPKGTQPEALVRVDETAREKSSKSGKPGLLSDRHTATIPTALKLKQDAAKKVYLEGVTDHDQGAKEMIDHLPDRTARK
jgi:hypothetical protein